jgi:23S rRNA (cytidine1920-2'-O)/16S rRNA (cytidine1409-2'-O)-methyltransferase
VTKRRLDQLLVERGLAETRTRAQALIMAGLVFSDEARLDKPGHRIADDAPLEVRGKDHPWVGRGGLKLDHALKHFGLDVAGRVALDLGASTGGFTDVLLAHGAGKVYAVDVGHGQLAWKLRQDARVVVLEKTNVRELDRGLIPEPIGAIVADLSFISLKTALPAALALAAPGALVVALVKPQFEAGREQVGKGGIVTDATVHEAVCRDIEAWLGDQPDWQVLGLTESPITGADGNREFLIAARKAG